MWRFSRGRRPGEQGDPAQHPQLRLPERNRLHRPPLRQDLRSGQTEERRSLPGLLGISLYRPHDVQFRFRGGRHGLHLHRDAQGGRRGIFDHQGILQTVRIDLCGGRRTGPDRPADQLPGGRGCLSVSSEGEPEHPEGFSGLSAGGELPEGAPRMVQRPDRQLHDRIRGHMAPYNPDGRLDWRIIVNGYVDQFIYKQKILDQSLPFSEM